jgi:hypothetical protein
MPAQLSHGFFPKRTSPGFFLGTNPRILAGDATGFAVLRLARTDAPGFRERKGPTGGWVERSEFGAPEQAGQAFGSPAPWQGPADLFLAGENPRVFLRMSLDSLLI